VRAAPGQQGGIGPEDGRLLYGIVRALRPENVSETGVAAGVSNVFLNAALVENGRGRLFSIELPSECQGRLQQMESYLHGQSVAWAGLFPWRSEAKSEREVSLS
jgi:predicted O-methyltransferase YrrM